MSGSSERYSCQIALPGFGAAGQKLLSKAKLLIVGSGGLGCPAAQYLVSSGIGTLGIADHDIISLSNLHRQILFTPAETGKKKTDVASQKLRQQNPDVQIVTHELKVTAQNVSELVRGYDIILDCTDNFETRYLINDACVLSGKPLVYGAIYQYEGQVAVWNVRNGDGAMSANYRDVFPEADASRIPDCSAGGVMPALAGIIGCMMANEAIKYITGTGALLRNKLLLFDARANTMRTIKTGPVSRARITGLEQEECAAVISARDLKEGLNGNGYLLVDVRSEEERNEYHIGGIHIPLELIETSLAELSQEQTIVFYCATGRRSMAAAKLAKKLRPGITVFSLEGGIAGWQGPTPDDKTIL